MLSIPHRERDSGFATHGPASQAGNEEFNRLSERLVQVCGASVVHCYQLCVELGVSVCRSVTGTALLISLSVTYYYIEAIGRLESRKVILFRVMLLPSLPLFHLVPLFPRSPVPPFIQSSLHSCKQFLPLTTPDPLPPHTPHSFPPFTPPYIPPQPSHPTPPLPAPKAETRAVQMSTMSAKSFAQSARTIAYLEGECGRLKTMLDHFRSV